MKIKIIVQSDVSEQYILTSAKRAEKLAIELIRSSIRYTKKGPKNTPFGARHNVHIEIQEITDQINWSKHK